MVALKDLPYDKAAALQTVSWATTSVLVIHILDWIHYFPDEVEYMWAWGSRLNHIKVHYFLSRYVMLALHIVHYGLSMQILKGSPTLKYCAGIFVYRVVIIICGAVLVETGLLLRVVALYHNNRPLVYLLTCFHVTCLGLQGIAHVRIISKSVTSTTECSPVGAERANLILIGVGVGMSQASFLGMTLFKLTSEKLWKKTSLAGLMLREGICMFILLVVILSSVALYEGFRNGQRPTVDLSEFLFSCYILSLSLSAPRLTLHLRKVVMKEPVPQATVPPSKKHSFERTRNIPTIGSVYLASYVE